MTQSAKYVFLDVVQFTHNRNVEAQSDIVDAMNKIVLDAITKYGIEEGTRLFIPTGDGLCIALMNTEGQYPHDIHMLVALEVLRSLDSYNTNEPDAMRQFQVRIGINSNEDNVIKDINGRPNRAGAGISLASRIMDKADGSQILLGESVFERLQQREKYMDRFKNFGFTDKHGKSVRVYQYVENSCPGLNIGTPRAFQREQPPEVKLSLQMAYYLAYAIKNREVISKTYKEDMPSGFALQLLLYLLSQDECEVQKAALSDSKVPSIHTWGFPQAAFEEQVHYYQSMELSLISVLRELVFERIDSEYHGERLFAAGIYLLFPTDKAKAKLKEEFPDIRNNWGLA